MLTSAPERDIKKTTVPIAWKNVAKAKNLFVTTCRIFPLRLFFKDFTFIKASFSKLCLYIGVANPKHRDANIASRTAVINTVSPKLMYLP